MRRVGPINRVAAYRDNSVKRDGNSHVIAVCRVGSATRVARFPVHTCLQRNLYLIFYLDDVGKLCKRIINHEVEPVRLLQGQIDEKAFKH